MTAWENISAFLWLKDRNATYPRRFQLSPYLDYSGTYSDRNGINPLSRKGGAWGSDARCGLVGIQLTIYYTSMIEGPISKMTVLEAAR